MKYNVLKFSNHLEAFNDLWNIMNELTNAMFQDFKAQWVKHDEDISSLTNKTFNSEMMLTVILFQFIWWEAKIYSFCSSTFHFLAMKFQNLNLSGDPNLHVDFISHWIRNNAKEEFHIVWSRGAITDIR